MADTQDSSHNLIEKQWAIDNVHIRGETHWWGFVLHLNEDAVGLLNTLTEIAELLIEALGEEIEPVADIISELLKLRSEIIQAEDQGTGVKLVSPWIMPTLLLPFPDVTHENDTQLRYIIYDPSTNQWSDEQKMKGDFSSAGPATAIFRERLYCAHRGDGDNVNIWWSVFDFRGQGWVTQALTMTSDCSPSMAVWNDYLYCVVRGGDGRIYWTRFDGDSWGGGGTIGEMTSTDGPAIVVYRNEFYCFVRGGDGYIYWGKFDGTTTIGGGLAGGMTSDSNAAVAVYNDRLYCVVVGGDSVLYWKSFDGQSWDDGGTLGGPCSAIRPGLAVMNGLLYCVLRGEGGDERLFWLTFDGTSWSPSSCLPSHRSAADPALVYYQDEFSQRQHLMCMYRGLST